jgi:hypothetical protein
MTRLVIVGSFVVLLITLLGWAETSVSGAVKYPYKTTVLVGNLPGSEADDTHGDAPGFSDLDALDEYYDAADGGNCDAECLAAKWLDLAHAGRAGLAPVGITVWVLRSVPDPHDSRYLDCRIQIQNASGPGDEWVLCDVLKVKPGGL